MKKVFSILLLLSLVLSCHAMEKSFRVDAKKEHARDQKQKRLERFNVADLRFLAHKPGMVLNGDSEKALRAILKEAISKGKLDASKEKESCHVGFAIPRGLRMPAVFGLTVSLMLVAAAAFPGDDIAAWRAQNAAEQAQLHAQMNAVATQHIQFAVAEAERQKAIRVENARKEDAARKDREIADLKERLAKLEAKEAKKDL